MIPASFNEFLRHTEYNNIIGASSSLYNTLELQTI